MLGSEIDRMNRGDETWWDDIKQVVKCFFLSRDYAQDG